MFILPWLVVALAAGTTTWLLIPVSLNAALVFEVSVPTEPREVDRFMGELTTRLAAGTAFSPTRGQAWRWRSAGDRRQVVTFLDIDGTADDWRAAGERAVQDALTAAQSDLPALLATTSACEQVAKAAAHLSSQMRELGGELPPGEQAHPAENESVSSSPLSKSDLADRAEKLAALASQLTDQHAALEQTRREHEELAANHPGASATVDDAERAKAYAADIPLTQDTSEMSAHFADVRGALRAVHERTTDAADAALAAASALDRFVEALSRRAELKDHATLIADLKTVVADYAALWTAFLPAWHQAHQAAVRTDSVDDAVIRLKEYEDMQRNFVFDADRALSDIEDRLSKLREAPTSSAALVTAVSDASRIWHDATSAFRVFERTLGPGRPVRLQAALESMNRLSARMRQRMAQIDRELAAEAARRLGDERLQRLEQLQDRLHQLQASIAETSRQIAQSAQSLAGVVRSALDAEAARARMRVRMEWHDRFQSDIAELNRAVASLTTASAPAAKLPVVRLVDVSLSTDKAARQRRTTLTILTVAVCLAVTLSAHGTRRK